MANHILVVEDDPDINRLLAGLFERQGHQVTAAFSGTEARLLLPQIGKGFFQLILLDLMLPGLSGEELIPEIRRESIVPIIVLSAKGRDDKYQVMKAGADDFISKPFELEDVSVRAEAQLRRYTCFSVPSRTILRHKKLELDLDNLTARVAGQPLSLTAREMGILSLLMQYPGKVFTRQNLFETVWQGEYLGDDNTIHVHISNLRSKLAKLDPGESYIQTVWGIGFKLADTP